MCTFIPNPMIIPPNPIVTTSIASPTSTDLVFCTFTPEKILPSLQNTSSPSLQSSPFRFKKHPQFSVLKSKVASLLKKTPFPKESHLRYKKPKTLSRSKVCFISSGWKKKRESKMHRTKVPKSVRSLKGSSLKKRNKESSEKKRSSQRIQKSVHVLSRRSLLKKHSSERLHFLKVASQEFMETP